MLRCNAALLPHHVDPEFTSLRTLTERRVLESVMAIWLSNYYQSTACQLFARVKIMSYLSSARVLVDDSAHATASARSYEMILHHL